MAEHEGHLRKAVTPEDTAPECPPCACSDLERENGHTHSCIYGPLRFLLGRGAVTQATTRIVPIPVSKCECHLPTDPPTGGKWWQPIVDDDPGPKVRAVVRSASRPRSGVRCGVDGGWAEHGAVARGYQDITPPMPWSRVGECWAEVSHPVVACEPWPL